LSAPWEVTYGPDNALWVTEAKGYTVSRIDPATGDKMVVLDLRSARNFPRYDKLPDEQDGGKPWPQGGLMGLALHPQFLRGKPYVYLAYVHRYAGAGRSGNGNAPNYGGQFFRTRVARYVYDTKTHNLTSAVSLCDTIPGSSDHNSGRLLIAPVEGKPYLFYTVGDMGAGQFDNAGRTNHSQQTSVYEGKVLRFNLEPDADRAAADQWVPNNNPFNSRGQNAGRQNAVWSIGHRNAQGLDYAVVGGVGRIYATEHGPFADDEVNIIEKGKNYGHPLVLGYNDNNYNGLAAGVTPHTSLPGVWHTTYPFIRSESENVRAIGTASYRDPIKSLYPLSADTLRAIFGKTKNDDPKKPDWPAEAPSSIAVYTSDAIPGWKNSLLIPTLKTGKIIRLQLSADGSRVTGDTMTYFKGPVRYRDIALSPDGTRLYVAVDSSSVTSGPSGEDPKGTAYRGCILEFTYQRTQQPAASRPKGVGTPLPQSGRRKE
ncbi:MAG TPA: PQQ-dependent sugar dehydrogenase, partial [Fibrella sp.]